MTNIPTKIFLQIDADGETPEDFKELQVTWAADKVFDSDLVYVHEAEAKKEAILFSEFKSDYRRIESMNTGHSITEKYGYPSAISWHGVKDEDIWNAFKLNQQLKRWFEK